MADPVVYIHGASNKNTPPTASMEIVLGEDPA